MSAELKLILDWAAQNPWLAFWFILVTSITIEIVAKCVVLGLQAIFQHDLSGVYGFEQIDDSTVKLTKVEK